MVSGHLFPCRKNSWPPEEYISRNTLHLVVIGPKAQEHQVCGVCSIQGHPSDKCPQLIENSGWESANAIGFQGQNQNNPYSNTYNAGWRDHPNFKWREPQQAAQQGGFRPNPPGFYSKPYAPQQPQQPQQPSASSHSGTSLESDQAMQLLTSISQGLQNQNNRIANNEKEMMDMKKQIGQISEFLGQIREQGKLPSSTTVNPKGGFESAKAITLRGGKEVGTEPNNPKSAQKVDEETTQPEEVSSSPTARVKNPMPQAPNHPNSAKSGNLSSNSCTSRPNLPNVPFPRRFMQEKKEESEKDILETFRKVQVNIPLLDAIKQVPKYAKFLKDLCNTKRRRANKEVVKDALLPDRSSSTHFGLPRALEEVRKIQPRKTLFTGMMHLMDHEKVNDYLSKLKETEGLDVQLSYDGLRVPVMF